MSSLLCCCPFCLHSLLLVVIMLTTFLLFFVVYFPWCLLCVLFAFFVITIVVNFFLVVVFVGYLCASMRICECALVSSSLPFGMKNCAFTISAFHPPPCPCLELLLKGGVFQNSFSFSNFNQKLAPKILKIFAHQKWWKCFLRLLDAIHWHIIKFYWR